MLDPASCEIPQAIRAICPDGLDISIEATGKPVVMQQALAVVRPRGGVAVIIGNARHGATLAIDPRQLNQGKQLRGSWGGDCVPDRDFPRYCRLLAAEQYSQLERHSSPVPAELLEQVNVKAAAFCSKRELLDGRCCRCEEASLAVG